jgi:tetratricopeptide (TPR) repeat protein/class 3 adenylate cyclase
MKRLIPEFIYHKYEEGKEIGNIQSLTMFLDISGFTNMTEELMREGKEGAEVLTSVLNSIFEPVIESIYKWGGFIASFAGDAFTAIFTDHSHPENIVYSAIEINRIFQEKRIQETKFGNFNFFEKIGLSYGNVEWGIVGTDSHKAFYFRGEAVDASAKSEQYSQKTLIVADNRLKLLLIDDIPNKTIREGYYLIYPDIDIPSKEALPIKPYQKEEIPTVFYSEDILKSLQEGDFRNVAPVFISISDKLSHDEIDRLASTIITDTEQYGGYFEGFDFGDKGGKCIVFFGAPLSHEKNTLRAVKFSESIREKLADKVRIGITRGTVFAGFKGSDRRCSYGLQGDTINLSSRLAMKADFGDILITDEVYKRITEEFNTQTLGETLFKGKTQPVLIYKLKKRKALTKKKPYSVQMMGRDEELRYLTTFLNPILQGKNAGVAYIYGEAGIGKSRLAYEMSNRVDDKVQTIVLQTDNILRKSLNPIIYGLSSYLKLDDLSMEEQRASRFDYTYGKLIQEVDSLKDERKQGLVDELKRTKDFIAYLFDISLDNAVLEQLPSRLRYENTLFAIKAMIKGISLINPLLIIAEDLHWFDNQSMDMFRILTRNVESYPFCVIATSRLNEDGSKPKLPLDATIPSGEVLIDNLESEAIPALIKEELGGEASKKLIDFINSKAQGNPFFIEQLCLYLKQNDILSSDNGNMTLTEEKVEIPSDVNSLLLSRIDRLQPEIKETAQTASVLGREFNTSILDKMFTIKATPGLIERLNRNINLGISKNIWEHVSGYRYMFIHALLHEAIYEMQPKKKLRDFHTLAGKVMEKEYKDDKGRYLDIANQYEKAEQLDKAKSYYMMAMNYLSKEYKTSELIQVQDKILKYNLSPMERIKVIKGKVTTLDLIGDYKSAIDYLNEGIKITTEEGIDSDKIWMIRILGWIYRNKGEIDKAEELFMEAKELAEKIDDRMQYSDTIGNIGLIKWVKGKQDEAMECFQTQKSIAEEMQDKERISMVLGNIGIVYGITGDYDNAEKCYFKILSLNEDLQDKHTEALANGNLGLVYMHKGQLDKALQHYEKQRQIATEIGDKNSILLSMGNTGIVYHQRLEYDKALQCYQYQKETAKEIGRIESYAQSLGNIGLVYQDRGDYDKAIEYYEKQIQTVEYYGLYKIMVIYYSNMGTIHQNLGNYDKAMELYQKQKQSSKESNDRVEYAVSISHIASLKYETGDVDSAINLYKEAIDNVKKLGVKYYISDFMHNLANIYYETGDIIQAEPLNEEALNLALEGNIRSITFKCKLLKYKINAIKEDKHKAINDMEAMLDEKNTGRQQATLYYELWKLSKGNQYKDEAIKYNTELFEKSPLVLYRKRLTELKTND